MNKKKTFTVGLDKTVGRMRTSKQFFGGAPTKEICNKLFILLFILF